MAASTFAELKAHFQPSKIVTPGAWTDVLDTLQVMTERLDAALAAGYPILTVANQTARLNLGPTLSVGRMVRQTDNGLTYSKQTDPGSLASEWVVIGASTFALSDVLTLIPTLDARLVNDANALAERLGLAQVWFHDLETIMLQDDVGKVLPVDPFAPQYSYATVGEDCRIEISPSSAEDYSGRTRHVLIYNPSLLNATVTYPETSLNQGEDGAMVLPSKKFAWLTFLFINATGYESPSVWVTQDIEE